MLKFFLPFLSIIGFLGSNTVSAQDNRVLNEREFTQACLTYLLDKRPSLELEVVQPLIIKAKMPEKDFGTLYLHNIYTLYRLETSRKDELFFKYAESVFDQIQEPPVSLEKLVAVVKSMDWVEDMNRMTEGEKGQGFHILSEPIIDNIFIVYATDSMNSMIYQDSAKILALEPSLDKIKQRAVQNLRDAIGVYDFELVEHDVYQLRSATGDYDASAALLPEVFNKFPNRKKDVEIVFSIPSRNILIATHSASKNGIAFLHTLAHKIYTTDPYSVSSSLFTLKNGAWNLYKE